MNENVGQKNLASKLDRCTVKRVFTKMMTVKKCYSQKFDEITVINIFNEMIQEV